MIAEREILRRVQDFYSGPAIDGIAEEQLTFEALGRREWEPTHEGALWAPSFFPYIPPNQQ